MTILQWHPKFKGKSLSEIKELSENKIFQEFQSEASVYVQNFRGSMFYTFQEDGILMLKGRNTIYGETRFKLVPTKTLPIGTERKDIYACENSRGNQKSSSLGKIQISY